MEKAKLVIHSESSSTDIPVLFNPEEYQLSRAVNYAKLTVPGLDNPILQYINGSQTTLTLTLFFDTQNAFIPQDSSQDVRDHTNPIMNALWIDGSLHAPPSVSFCWGSFSFTGVITNAKQSFILFLPDGMPVRARLELTFESLQTVPDDKKQSPFESPDRTKIRFLEQEAALWRLACAEYGDPRHWRRIAEANGIHNPRKCQAGQSIRVPPLQE